MSAVVTLLTDFGTADSYVGELKGTLLRLAPGVTVVDLTHEVPLGDVVAGAWVLGRAAGAFPAGAVHCAVVDPGVGSARRALAVTSGEHHFVGPDNGLLSVALAREGARAIALPVPAEASATFHGRDVFAPAAAALARGTAIEGLGSPVTDAVRLPAPRLAREGRAMVGEVVYVDRFGTLVTSVPGAKLAPGSMVRIGVYDVPLKRTFSDVATGEPVAFVGSGGTLEIAIRDGKAAETLGLSRGAEVRAVLG